MIKLSPRQIHLDFHTSEFIPNIASEFNPMDFAQIAKSAAVSSMTVFARGHHGWLYYDSKCFPELVHPGLTNKNLLIDQIHALHNVGIKAPVYITVQWDYHSASIHPEWLIRKPNGAHEGGTFFEPGFYQSLCVNTGYYDFLEAQTREICLILSEKNALDGVFFDIVGIRPCWCASCRKDMEALGIDMNDENAVRKFAASIIDNFKLKMTSIVREYSSECTIFYNAGHIGPCVKNSSEAYTHFELESLPSGGWGYLHFPATIRYARTLGYDCMGMTGKFHTSWGDFHSLKNQAALEFECFRMLSFGCACSIGDQLEPNGKLNSSTYKLIGNVYKQVAAYEQYARPAIPFVEAAVVTNEPAINEHNLSNELLGACQMLEEISLQFDIIDREMDLTQYKLIILTDNIESDEAFTNKINDYVNGGGSVISTFQGGKNSKDEYPESFKVKYNGLTDKYPDFIVRDENEYVMYMQGANLSSNGAKSLMCAHSPYFRREGNHFCSHRYTPSAKGEEYPVVFRNGNVIVFSHPIFAQYRDNAPHWCKEIMEEAIDILLSERIVKHDGPSTLCVSLLDQPEKKRINIHLLSYIPVRKSASIDIIEERTKLYDVQLDVNLPHKAKSLKSVISGRQINVVNGKINIPVIDGYEIITIEY